MTRVTELSVRDFKAVDEAEVHPGGVNLIVGRNNVGKTSLLEALHLALDPSSISRFDGNLDKVVREGAEEATVNIEVGGDVEVANRPVTVERYDEDAAFDLFRRDLEAEVRKVLDEISDYTAETASIDKQEAIKSAKNRKQYKRLNRLLSIVNGDTYHSTEYIKLIKETAVNRDILERTLNNEESLSNPIGVSGDYIYNLEGTRFEFGWSESEELMSTRFVVSPGITNDTPDPNTDGAAIRRSRIEDFLIDNDIVDGLVDFSFGRLVFEEGDEREEVPYDFMGSGFKTLVGILWELYDQDADTEVMLIEEPAVHMHPGYVNEFTQQLLQVARQEDVQLFLTTHREDLIESFFAPPTEREHGDFLREEFRVIQMTDLLAKELDYEQAEAELEELNTDLRGI
ncbi:ATP-binding protein [Halobaculum sp. MBLA0143]|uniref:ATP-binding protein n=1 Tax=Halobaculum sp. MBLA0143 TaxID=3079933 RepID=UPI003523984F